MGNSYIEEDDMSQFYTRRGKKSNVGGESADEKAAPAAAPSAGEETVFAPSDDEFGTVFMPEAATVVAAVAAEKSRPQAAPERKQAAPERQEEQQPVEPAPEESPEAPVVGFLFSVSSGRSEHWVLRLGCNVVGSGATCDIRLDEVTVDERHAQINIACKGGKLTATIEDLGSRQGTFVNGLEADGLPCNCYDRDIITIGGSYQLLLLVADAGKYGLAKVENFCPTSARSGGDNTPADDEGTIAMPCGGEADEDTIIM